jgi:hypothetical protein
MKSTPVNWLIRAIDRHLSEESKIDLREVFKTAREMEAFGSMDRTTTTCANFSSPYNDDNCIYCGQTKNSHVLFVNIKN